MLWCWETLCKHVGTSYFLDIPRLPMNMMCTCRQLIASLLSIEMYGQFEIIWYTSSAQSTWWIGQVLRSSQVLCIRAQYTTLQFRSCNSWYKAWQGCSRPFRWSGVTCAHVASVFCISHPDAHNELQRVARLPTAEKQCLQAICHSIIFNANLAVLAAVTIMNANPRFE